MTTNEFTVAVNQWGRFDVYIDGELMYEFNAQELREFAIDFKLSVMEDSNLVVPVE